MSPDSKKVCKWYDACPMKRFYEQGELEEKWIERYYRMEERGEPHTDNMLPNGEVREDLTDELNTVG